MFEQALLNASPDAVMEEGDYLQDGLIYCGKCRTPRQHLINGTGTGLDGKVVQIACSCRAEAERAQKDAKRAIENTERLVAHNRAMIEAGIAEPFPNVSFDKDDEPNRRISQIARAYVAKWADVYKQGGSLLLYGPPGTGKPFMAACIANALFASGSDVLYTNIRKLSNAANRNFGEDADLVQLEVQRCSLLVLDDFGVERDTSYSWEQTERIINWRYETRKPMIATTNLSPAEMQGGDITRQRVFDRIQGMCTTIKVDGESRRKLEAAKKKQELRELLGV